MRENKYRAWDKDMKKMRTVTALFLSEQKDAEKIKVRDGNEIGTWLVPSEYELMQSTGFKDRNGKKIHEGDIIQIFTKTTNEPAYEKRVEIPDFYSLLGLDKCEIIGNIYENPELLK